MDYQKLNVSLNGFDGTTNCYVEDFWDPTRDYMYPTDNILVDDNSSSNQNQNNNDNNFLNQSQGMAQQQPTQHYLNPQQVYNPNPNPNLKHNTK